jgi:hypothetical protein
MSHIRLGEVVLTDFTALVDAANQVRIGLLGLERRVGAWTETIRIAHDRPMLTVSWDRAADDNTPARVRFAIASSRVVACTPARLELSCGERGVLIVEADSPVAWHFQDGGVAVEWTATALRLTLAAVAADGVVPPGVEASLKEPRMIERSASAALDRLAADGLILESRAEVLDGALLRARAQLAFAPVTAQGQRESALCVFGALAGGDNSVANAWLRALLANAAAHMQDMGAAAWSALAAARHLAWTGDVAVFAEAWPVVSQLVAAIVSKDVIRQIPVAATAVREAALAAEIIGERALAASWRAAPAARSNAADPILDGMSAQRLRELGANPMVDVSAAGHFIAAVAGGLLGAEPDATRHRLRLRPRVPDDLWPLRAGGLRMGEAAFLLKMTADLELLRLEVEQVEGPVPVTLVFEPWVRARAIRAVRIDGRPAELELRPLEDGWVIPVQIALDHVRQMDIERES